MAEPTEITAEEWAKWLTPAEARDLLPSRSVQQIYKLIARRLADGLIVARAETVVFRGKAQPPALLPKAVWAEWSYWADDLFWEHGDTNFPSRDGTGYGTVASDITVYGVRFEPAGVLKLVPAPAAQSVADTPAPMPDTVHAPVSEHDLKAWWTFYQAVRPVTLQTEDDAFAHFERCLPDKKVTRTRLRGLRGPQKSGPKSKSAE